MTASDCNSFDCLYSFPQTNLQELNLCQIYTNITLLCGMCVSVEKLKTNQSEETLQFENVVYRVHYKKSDLSASSTVRLI